MNDPGSFMTNIIIYQQNWFFYQNCTLLYTINNGLLIKSDIKIGY